MRTIHHSTRSTTRRLGGLLVGVATLLALLAGPASAGPDPDRLADAGWTCLPHLGALHCSQQIDEVLAGQEPATATFLTWGLDAGGEPGDFWGTELLIHEDLYSGQPCPQDPLAANDGRPGDYIHSSELGAPFPYYVCHHFDSPVT